MNTEKKILIIGDIMLDINTYGTCSRISPEAPVQVVRKTQEIITLGGAGNNLVNIHHLNISTDFISVIGNDSNGKVLLQEIKKIPSTSPVIFYENRKTTTKNRILANKHQVLRIDEEDTHNISNATENKIIQKIKKNISTYSVILISDYNKGVCTKKLISKIISIANQNNVKVICDPKKDDISIFTGCYFITPNKNELEKITKNPIKTQEDLKNALLMMKKFVEIPLVTLSEEGIAYTIDDNLHISHAIAKDVVDVTGAGDTVISTLAYCIHHNISIPQAVELANKAASIVVSKLGTSFVTKHELHQENTKIVSNIANIQNELSGKKIVFTNGCFDILHKGHVKYLQKAKNLGDILIVGINSDSSVKRLKGNSRPINSLQARMEVLEGLSCIDYIIPFEEDTPYNLICQIQPDILVKGGDYIPQNIIGNDIAKSTIVIQFEEGFSTTKIIESIQKQ